MLKVSNTITACKYLARNTSNNKMSFILFLLGDTVGVGETRKTDPRKAIFEPFEPYL